MIAKTLYPLIATADGYEQAVASDRETTEMCRAVAIMGIIAQRAAVADPWVEPALERFAGIVSDAFEDLLKVLTERRHAICAYEEMVERDQDQEPAP